MKIYRLFLAVLVLALTVLSGVNVAWEKGSALPTISIGQKTYAAVEDFTSWTVGGNTTIVNVTANNITVVNMTRTNGARVYKDMGANGIDSTFSYNGVWRATQVQSSAIYFPIIATGNATTGDVNSDPFVYVFQGTDGKTYLNRDIGSNDGNVYTNSTSLNITYYFTFAHAVSTNYTFSIWTNSARTGATVASLSINSSTEKWRYIYTAFTYTGTDSNLTNGWIADVDLGGESAAPTVVANSATSVEEATATLSMNITAGSPNATSESWMWDTDTGAPYANIFTDNGDYGVGPYTHAITGLSKGTKYFVSANATNTAGTGTAATETTFITKPDLATNFRSTENTSSSVSLNWTSPTGATLFGIRYAKGDTPPADNVTGTLFEMTANPYSVVTGLDSSANYSFRLDSYATNGLLISKADGDVYTSDVTDAGVSGDEVTTGVLSLVSTIECIGFSANYTGDSNNNTSLVVKYTTDNVTWHDTIDMNSIYRSSTTFAGSIFGLTTNITYTVNMTFSDSNGVVGTNPLIATVKTLDDNPPLGIVHTYYVSISGNDTSGDGSIGTPWQTIQKAANTVVAGDTVYVRAGTYNETVTITVDGTANNFISFLPYPGESVTVDGSPGNLPRLFYLNDANYVRIKGFNIQNSHLYSAIDVFGSDYDIIENNTVINPVVTQGGGGVYGLQSGIYLNSGSIGTIVQYNHIEVNSSNGSVMGIGLNGIGNSNVIRYNNISGNFTWLHDGITSYPENASGFSNTDIYSNNISNCNDDDLQLDGNGINTRCWDNIGTSLGNNGISVAPISSGPTYVFRNVTHNSYKFDGSQTGRLYLYHNTLYTTNTSKYGLAQENGGVLNNIVSRNNIYHVTGYIYSLYDFGTGTNDVDYDDGYTTGANYAKWNGDIAYATLAAFRTASGQALNNISSSNNGFTNIATGDFTLLSSSPDINAGIIIVGFNDASSPWPYSGAAPDMGYDEYDEGLTAPVVTVTTGASLITDTTARLNGNVTNSGGENCTVTIYGPQITDGGTDFSAWSDNGTPDLPVQPQSNDAFQLDVSGLTPSTLYYYSASGNNSAGTGWAVSGNFTTLSGIVAPTVTTVGSSSITATTAIATGNITSTGGANVTIRGIQWGIVTNTYTTNITEVGVYGVATFNESLVSLSSGTTIFYRAEAYNSSGWAYGSELTLLTLPAAPTNVSATDGASTSNVTVTWTKSTGGTGYLVYRGVTLIATLGDVASHVDTGADLPVITGGATSASQGTSNTTITVSISGQSVANGTTASYTVKATNASGNSVASAADNGYVGHGALTLQLQRSAADSDAAYSNIVGATTSPYADPIGIIGGRWYRWVLNATGAIQQVSLAERGYTIVAPIITPPPPDSTGGLVILAVLTLIVTVILNEVEK